jgi:aspartyl-tRNA(Asn)/glutamyl-tRNA(Gln) amidotransferase subunit C
MANEIDVKYVAHLARIGLSPEEERAMAAHLGGILGYIEKLRELDVTGVPMVNVMRADVVRPSLAHEAAMANAPAQANGLFLVPKIVE